MKDDNVANPGGSSPDLKITPRVVEDTAKAADVVGTTTIRMIANNIINCSALVNPTPLKAAVSSAIPSIIVSFSNRLKLSELATSRTDLEGISVNRNQIVPRINHINILFDLNLKGGLTGWQTRLFFWLI